MKSYWCHQVVNTEINKTIFWTVLPNFTEAPQTSSLEPLMLIISIKKCRFHQLENEHVAQLHRKTTIWTSNFAEAPQTSSLEPLMLIISIKKCRFHQLENEHVAQLHRKTTIWTSNFAEAPTSIFVYIFPVELFLFQCRITQHWRWLIMTN